MEAFFVSTGLVALAEIGDKTQLLALLLAARYRKPIPIILGITVATIANHALAAFAGNWVADHIPMTWFNGIIGVSFLAIALWTLIPDSLEDTHPGMSSADAFIATLVAFFIAEIGDKTQVATVLLAAKYEAMLWVIAGTTLGMLIANIPSVYLGDWLNGKLPLRAIRFGAAFLFAATGVYTLVVGI